MEKNMSDGMKLDVRLPIGGMFALIGAIITIYGLVSDPAIYERSLGINVNFWWGLVLFAFGAFMLIMAWRGAKKH
jgi:hypothetical protein